jgi:Leucine-rich repeat (LRR) protein
MPKGVDLSRTRIDFIPKGLEFIFPSLRCLEIAECDLNEISREDLNGLENFETLDLRFNQLKSLPTNLFENMPKLKVIRLNNNKLQFVSSEMLKPFLGRAMTLINFRGNPKIDLAFEPKRSSVTLKQLMKQIDEKCGKPFDNEESGESQKFQGNYFEDLWQSRKFANFVVTADNGKRFQVHKSVLGMRSSTFADIFEKNVGQNEMKLDNFEADSIEEFLRYLYIGKSADKFSTMEIFALAAKFKVDDLKAKSQKILLNQINSANAFKVFTIAHRYSSDELKRKSFEQVKKSFAGFDLPENLIEMPKKLKEILEKKK